MEVGEDFFDESKERIAEYVQDRLLLLKLEAVEKGSKLVASMFAILIVALFAFLVLLFLSTAVGYLLGEVLGHLFWGFGIVAGLYIILLVVIIVFRKKLIEKHVINLVISIVFEKSNEEINGEKHDQ